MSEVPLQAQQGGEPQLDVNEVLTEMGTINAQQAKELAIARATISGYVRQVRQVSQSATETISRLVADNERLKAIVGEETDVTDVTLPPDGGLAAVPNPAVKAAPRKRAARKRT